MPARRRAGSLAESWTVSPDGLVYEFVLAAGREFHNGGCVHGRRREVPLRALQGARRHPAEGARASVDVVDPLRIRFRLKAPWPDFMPSSAPRRSSGQRSLMALLQARSCGRYFYTRRGVTRAVDG